MWSELRHFVFGMRKLISCLQPIEYKSLQTENRAEVQPSFLVFGIVWPRLARLGDFGISKILEKVQEGYG